MDYMNSLKKNRGEIWHVLQYRLGLRILYQVQPVTKKKPHKKPILDNSMYMRYLEGIIHRDSRIVISRVWWGRGEDRVAV